jgi:DNA-binding beta-propeller fold protein YncE
VDINGTTNSVNTSVPVGICPTAIAVNPASGQVYVANYSDVTGDGTGTVSIINEGTLVASSVVAGYAPIAIDVDLGTNKVYVANAYPDPNLGNTVTVIDGYTASALPPVPLEGNAMYPEAIVVNPASNSAYVADSGYNSVSIIAGASADPLQFVPVTPCRVADTRQQPNGYLPGGMARSFAVPQSNCNIPATAIAYSLNVTVVPVQGRSLGYLTVWPTGEPQPQVSILNSLDGRIKANAAILPAGGAGAVSVYATDSTDVILDINGYFQLPDPNIPTLQFFPLTPCRVVDTRPGNQNYPDLGPPALAAQAARELPILNAAPCFRQVPPGVIPKAYSFNVTVVPNPPGQSLGYVTLWPSDQHQPIVSTLNNLKATLVANAAIVPAAPNGNVDVSAYNSTDLILDVNGYFAAPAPGGLSLYPSTPCRVLDTRHDGGAFNGLRNPPANIAAGPCGIPTTAQGYVLNATVVPVSTLGYLSLWADPGAQPLVSTLNAVDGSLTSNMAIVGNQDGSIDAYAGNGPTQLILDISSYFAP